MKKTKTIINQEWDEIFNKYKKCNLSNYAFPLYLFTTRLYDELKKNGYKDVLFMSREGQFLKILFDKYCSIKKELGKDVINIKSHYFYGSRNSIMKASVKSINEEDFKFLFRFFSFMSAKSFMFSIGFSNEQIEQVKQNFSRKIDKTFLNFKNSKTFKLLKQNETFIKIYNDNRSQQSQAFNGYAKSFGINYEKDGLTFVDIGYHGTMQDLISKFFKAEFPISGYFIKSRAKQFKNNTKKGLLSDNVDKKIFGGKINKYDAFNYEQILRADHGRCLGYKLDGNTSHAVVDTKGDDKQVYDKYVADVQNKILEKFELIARKNFEEDTDISAICVIYYYNTIKHKTKLDYKWLIDMQDNHHDDFGFVGYPGRMFARTLRKIVFKTRDKLFVLKNACYIKKLKKRINKKH